MTTNTNTLIEVYTVTAAAGPWTVSTAILVNERDALLASVSAFDERGRHMTTTVHDIDDFAAAHRLHDIAIEQVTAARAAHAEGSAFLAAFLDAPTA